MPMPSVERDTGCRQAPCEGEGEGDRFLRIGDILELLHCHPPSQPVILRDEPEEADDCLIVKRSNIQHFGLTGAMKWACYRDVTDRFAEMRAAGSNHLSPYSREDVFAPVKIVLAETDSPLLRAAVVYEPAYPWQNKLGIPKPGQRLWLVYAACAALNSRYGLACCRLNKKPLTLRSKNPPGVNLKAAREIPVARQNWEWNELTEVAALTHQLGALYDAEHEALPELTQQDPTNGWTFCSSFQAALQAARLDVTRRLDDACRRILGLTESEEEVLLNEVRLPDTASSAQRRFLHDWDMLQPVPPSPVQLLPASYPGPGTDAQHLAALRIVRYWETVVNSPPPRAILTGSAVGDWVP